MIKKSEWGSRHVNDEYVKKAKTLNRVSRASFKIDHIQERFQIFKPGQYILDCGAAPGGWSQQLAEFVRIKNSETPLILAVDLLAMKKIKGVVSWVRDLNDPNIITDLMNHTCNNGFDHIVSDAMSNVTGHRSLDEAQWGEIFFSIKQIAFAALKTGGSLVVKLWSSCVNTKTLLDPLQFESITLFKPKSSRTESSEIYLVAQKLIKNLIID